MHFLHLSWKCYYGCCMTYRECTENNDGFNRELDMINRVEWKNEKDWNEFFTILWCNMQNRLFYSHIGSSARSSRARGALHLDIVFNFEKSVSLIKTIVPRIREATNYDRIRRRRERFTETTHCHRRSRFIRTLVSFHNSSV